MTQMKSSAQQEQIHRQNRVVVATGEGDWRRDGLGFWGQKGQNIRYRMGKQADPTLQTENLKFYFLLKDTGALIQNQI